MIFTCNKRLAEEDISNVDKIETGLEQLIKFMKCMRGVDEEFMPSFKFLQFRKSLIKDLYSKED